MRFTLKGENGSQPRLGQSTRKKPALAVLTPPVPLSCSLRGHLCALILVLKHGGIPRFPRLLVLLPGELAIAPLEGNEDFHIWFFRRSLKIQSWKFRHQLFEDRERETPCRIKFYMKTTVSVVRYFGVTGIPFCAPVLATPLVPIRR